MEYKRKIKSKQEGMLGEDASFGKLMMKIDCKKGMPTFFCILMIVFIMLVWFGYVKDIMSLTFVMIASLIFLAIGILELSFALDHIQVYEYGIINCSWLNLKKRRIAYDEITSVVAKRVRNKQKNVSLWHITIKDKKRSISLDANTYKNINDLISALAHEAKINIVR